MDKLDLQTPNFTNENIQKLSELFPNCVTEDGDGKTINFDLLKQELSNHIVEGNKERYELSWPGKAESLVTANIPINKTLRPNREESKGFDNTENLYIEGDNLEALKLLQETYLGKVKIIYADPPYNTGNDILYKNDFSDSEENYLKFSQQVNSDGFIASTNVETNGKFHSDWLSMIYPRIKLARNLLKDDGIFVITIDHNELHSLISICDELFGENNKLGIIAIRNNPAGRSTAKGVSICHEYALFYGKTNLSIMGRLPRTKSQIDRYKEKDEKGLFEWVNFRKPGSKKDESPKMHYPIFASEKGIRLPKMDWDPKNRKWQLKEDLLPGENIVFPVDDEGKDRRWRWAKEKFLDEIYELKPRFIKESWHVYLKARIPNDGILPNTWWDKKEYSSTAYGTNMMKKMFGELQAFTYPKSLYAVIDCIKIMSSNDNTNKDIILDFFSGSATSAQAVMQLNAEDGGNRKYIMVQIPEATNEESEAYLAGYKTIAEIGKERIRRAGKKIKEENGEKENIDKLDVGFRVLKVDSSNMKDVYFTPDETNQADILDLASNIKEDRSGEDLLFMVLLNWGIDLSAKIEKKDIQGKEVYFVDDNYLAACFDKDIDENFIKALTDEKPLKVILQDNSFVSSSVKINVEQIFEQANIEAKVI